MTLKISVLSDWYMILTKTKFNLNLLCFSNQHVKYVKNSTTYIVSPS